MASRRSHLILVVLILAALGGVALLGVKGSPAHKTLKKGLDLQGGLEVILKAQPPKGHKLTSDDMSRSISIIRNRIDKLGVSEPIVRQESTNQISVQLAGVHDVAKAAALIGKTAQLELYDLVPALLSPSVSATGAVTPYRSLYQLLTRVQATAKTGTPSAYYLFGPRKGKLVCSPSKKKGGEEVCVTKGTGFHLLAGPAQTLHRDKTTGIAGLLDAYNGKVPAGDKVLGSPDKTVVISCSAQTTSVCPGETTTSGLPPAGQTDYYLFKHGSYPNDRYATDGKYPNMTGNDLKLSGIQESFDTNTGSPIVQLAFTGHGNSVFHQVTKNEAIRGEIKNEGANCSTDCAFAIVLDNQLRSWPAVNLQDSPNGIDPVGGGAEINNIGSQSEAKDLALVLQTGALPINFVTVERTDVSATLGKDSLKQAEYAAIGGLIAVAIFLLLLYRFLGLVAVLGLGIYAAFMYAAILLFGVVLTLPGFAGLILTIGVAADANVVVFERIKEEVRSGKSVRAAIPAGYAKGFRTIVDANVVTAITAMILFAVATAGVKGFALMLLIGTVVSLITAVAATRAMLGLLAGFRWFENPSFMGAHGQQGLKFLQVDFMSRRRTWFAISGIVIIVGAVSLGVRGLNFGIDFKGGAQVSFTTPQPTSLATVRDQPKAIGRSDAVVQGRGKVTGSDSYKSFQIQVKKLSPNQQDSLSNLLKTKLGAQKLGITNVSSSFGRQIARAAVLAIIFSLLIITLYITIRFHGLAFAIPVILAMLHDVVITVGVYSVTGREVSEDTVAAVLTVLGYSIYDTIIIFDRIRENVPLMRRAPFATIVNVSLWETIRRSLATTFITLLPVGGLFLFGGTTLKDFAFALLIGITSGAYSSIFIAAPMVCLWKEREPEFAHRKRVAGNDDQVLAAAEGAAAEEPTPATPIDVVETGLSTARDGDAEAKRERRRQRRQSRPHGRPR
ncbi:MAG TPA: protein translocase subunit SecD [Gaiellaceae bacterium]